MNSAPLNRTVQPVFFETVQREMDAAATGGEALGLVLVKLANVSDLNAAAGYAAVDAMLADFGTRLESAFRERGVVLRIGTRRFALLVRALKSEAHGLLAANKIARLAADSAAPDLLGVALKASQGIALYPAHAGAPEELLRCAEAALAAAQRGEQVAALYRPEDASELEEPGRIEAELARALQAGGIEAFFQPQVELSSGRVVGAEALLRCRDRRGGFLAPEAVIGAAERSNRLGDVTSAVLNTALRHAAEWRAPGCGLSVNVGTSSLKDSDFVAVIAGALGLWHWPPGALTIEITESAFMDRPDRCFATLHALKRLGVRVAIDDFGTGYSSLAYFTNIPANELKVDKSFVFRMLGSHDDRRIVQAVIGLAHGFDLKVVAEGVENEATLAVLAQMGCDAAQGYHISRPLPPAEFRAWLAGRRAGAPGGGCDSAPNLKQC